ncbi:MAG: AraC family transcriptional regulator [Alphaproteobacteria bacterium]|jgi:AraC-like DNA-binding protein|nr:AraC family transcriptional regulator [Alphaproteobacteria bacterium]
MTRPITVRQGAGWEVAGARPAGLLGQAIDHYQGYVEKTAGPVRRREFTAGKVVFIFGLGPSITLVDPVADGARRVDSFVAGLDDGFTITETTGAQSGIQLNLDPLVAGRLFGLPIGRLTREVVDFADLWGDGAGGLVEQLQAARDWSRRFDLLDRHLAPRLAAGSKPNPTVAWAWRRLRETGGLISITELAADIGWSRKHLATQFRDHVGLAPKAVARLMRLGAAVRALDGGGPAPELSGLALDCGYYDQAHFIHDFRRLTGLTPTAYLRRRADDDGIPGTAAPA